MERTIVVAYGKNREIGTRGDLPWGRDLPSDLVHFKHQTIGKSIIMGRKTFESIGSRPLPDRENIILSSKPTGIKGALTAINIESALALARYPVCFIGGTAIFAAALPCTDRIFATEVDAGFPDADTFFPELGPEWQEIVRHHHERDERNKYNFDIVEYRKAALKNE